MSTGEQAFAIGKALILTARRAPGASFPHCVGAAIALADSTQAMVELFFMPGVSIVVESVPPDPYITAATGIERTRQRIIAYVEQINAALELHKPPGT